VGTFINDLGATQGLRRGVAPEDKDINNQEVDRRLYCDPSTQVTLWGGWCHLTLAGNAGFRASDVATGDSLAAGAWCGAGVLKVGRVA
jgi:hypothetical protein